MIPLSYLQFAPTIIIICLPLIVIRSLPVGLWSEVYTGKPGTTMMPCPLLNKDTFTMRTNSWGCPDSDNSKSVLTPVWFTRTSKMSFVNATTPTPPI